MGRCSTGNDAMLPSIVRRLLEDDGGQDLIEYALLASIVATAGVAIVPVIQNKMQAFVTRWVSSGAANSVQDLWIPPLPGS